MVKVYERNLDEMGRLQIPVELARDMELQKGQELEITMEHGIICIKHFDPNSIGDRPYVGIIRKVHGENRIVVPVEYYKIVGIHRGGKVHIYLENQVLKII